MKHLRIAALLLVAATVATACSRGDAATPAAAAPTTAPSHGQQATGTLPRLVFFMNPNGMPCQMQDRILRELSSELSSRVDVVYYRTTEPADLARFQEYGIRSLPQILVTDATGRELRRATPGIQGPEQVRSLVAP